MDVTHQHLLASATLPAAATNRAKKTIAASAMTLARAMQWPVNHTF